MLINLRNALMSGKRLPYDAEVEYLDADNIGIQLFGKARCVIDTGIVPNLETDVWECDAQFISFGAAAGCWGATGNRFAFGRGSASWRDWYFGYGNTNNRTDANLDNLRHIFRLDAPNRRFSVDSATYSGNGNTVSGYENRTITIFNRNNDGGVRAVFDNSLSRLYSSKYYRNGILIQHLIPVRKGTIGAVYDRRGVGGMNPDGSPRNDGMYFNHGTGDFVLGPDVSASSRGGYKRPCVKRSHRRSLRPSARFRSPSVALAKDGWRTPLWKEVA